MSIRAAQRLPRRLLRRGDGAAHSRKRTSDVPLGSVVPLFLERSGSSGSRDHRSQTSVVALESDAAAEKSKDRLSRDF